MGKRVVYFDMDGVLVRYPEGQDDGVDFHALGPIPEMVELYQRLVKDERYEVYIASTAPWSEPEAWMAKRLWVERYLGEGAFKRLTLTHHKEMLIGDYLIDDRLANGAAEFRGEHIQYREGEMSIAEVEQRIGY